MMPRSSIERKYRPAFEALERKQLLSSGPPTYGPQPFHQVAPPVPSHQVAPPVPSHAEHEITDACGTGTGIRIITS